MASPDHAGSVARSGGNAAHPTDAARSAARSTAAQAAGHAALDAGSISARLDRLPATRSIWKLVVLLSLGFFFELYDLLYSGYVAPGLVKSGLLSATTRGLFGSTGVASFIAALFSGLFIGTIACGFLADRFGRRAVLTIFNVFQTVGFYGFANWVPTLLIKQGITITTSLMYSSVIALAAPIGPIMGLFIGDRFERKTVIVVMAGANIVCGLWFSQASGAVLLVSLGVCLTLAGNIISYSYHAYQTELFPTSIRAHAVGFVYSWSRFSAIFTAFLIAAVLRYFGTTGVFVFIAGAMLIVMLAIGLMGPRTKGLELEKISR
ncbi:MFS transporter [Paraburkholderia sp. BR14374]|uniref:MFS transporter n=1 Tax=Paraburkholderia sp. BR14374 TaxID=3237007 RepID=UPI0034CDF45C